MVNSPLISFDISVSSGGKHGNFGAIKVETHPGPEYVFSCNQVNTGQVLNRHDYFCKIHTYHQSMSGVQNLDGFFLRGKIVMRKGRYCNCIL